MDTVTIELYKIAATEDLAEEAEAKEVTAPSRRYAEVGESFEAMRSLPLQCGLVSWCSMQVDDADPRQECNQEEDKRFVHGNLEASAELFVERNILHLV